MKALVSVVIVGFSALLYQQSNRAPAMHDASAITYEHLATAIIEIEATEDNLVKGILMHYHGMAQDHLHAAANAQGSDRRQHLEAAADEIGNIANEGDKRVMAIRQRLLKAGHTHHTDAETKEDYMFIDSKEKKQFVTMAQNVGKMGANATPADLNKVAGDLQSTFDKAIASQ